MILIFRRIGAGRYAIAAKRAPFRDLEMSPASGYKRWMPHDLMLTPPRLCENSSSRYHRLQILCKNSTSHSPQASAWGCRCLRRAANRFNGLSATRKYLGSDAIWETVKTVAEIRTVSADPKLKLGENERLRFF